MTRRRRPERVDLSEMTLEAQVAHILDGVKDPTNLPRLAAELDALEAALSGLDALVIEVRAWRMADEHDAVAGVEGLEALRFPEGRIPKRKEYDPSCFTNPDCDCSACVEMRRLEALEGS